MGLIAQLLEKRSPVMHIVSPHQTVDEAVAIMATRKVGAVPVVKDGRLVGIFSERDLLRRVVYVHRPLEKTEIGEVMTPDPLTASPSDERALAVRKMDARRLPPPAGRPARRGGRHALDPRPDLRRARGALGRRRVAAALHRRLVLSGARRGVAAPPALRSPSARCARARSRSLAGTVWSDSAGASPGAREATANRYRGRLMRVALAQLDLTIGDFAGNLRKIREALVRARGLLAPTW